ncbi:unnamed protein product, partial [Rotaria sp. Silwood2]
MINGSLTDSTKDTFIDQIRIAAHLIVRDLQVKFFETLQYSTILENQAVSFE